MNTLYKATNPIKNALQYTIGSILYFIFFSNFNLTTYIIGLIGFLIAYQSVYFFNDVMDYEDDRKSVFKKKIKMETTGKLKKNTMISLSYILSAIGIAICFFINKLLGFAVIALLIMNFLHSSNLIKWKKTSLVLPNMFSIEFIKYSLGWFIFTSSLAKFPIFLFALLSMLYILGYAYYKQDIKHFLTRKILYLCAISIAFYILSIFLYPFKLALFLPLPIAFTFFIFRKINDNYKRMIIGSGLVNVFIFAFIFSLVLVTIKPIESVNNNISIPFDCLKNNITENLPEGLVNDLKNLTEKLNTTDVGKYINCNITNVTITK